MNNNRTHAWSSETVEVVETQRIPLPDTLHLEDRPTVAAQHARLLADRPHRRDRLAAEMAYRALFY